MKKVALTALVLLSLFSIAYALKCYTCTDSISCKTRPVTCSNIPHNETCMTLKIGSKVGKSCSQEKSCKESCQGHSDCEVSCCATDLCNSSFRVESVFVLIMLMFCVKYLM